MSKFPFSKSKLIKLVNSAGYCLFFAVVFFTTFKAFAQTTLQNSASVSTILNADGSVKPGITGSFDPNCYKLSYGPKGKPKFTPADQSIQTGCNDGWESSFAVNGAIGSIRTIVSDGQGNLYIGGAIGAINNTVVKGIAKWDGTSWSALGSGIDGRVDAIAIANGNVYVAGDIRFAGGVAVNNVAKWNGTSWSALGSGIGSGSVQGVLAIAASNNDVYVGGDFNANGGFPNFVAHWDGTSWTSMGTGMNNSVYALAVSGGNVYAGGFFTTAGGVTATGIAKWDGTAWTAVGSGVSNRVKSIAVSGANIYVGGSFTSAGGNSANSVAKWDGSSWSALGTGIDGGEVRAITVSGSDVYVGGTFTTAGGLSAIRVAKWNGSVWSQMGSGIDGSPLNGTVAVNGIAVLGNTLLTGGEFDTAGGVNARKIAKWSANTWTAFQGNSLDSVVRSVAVSGTDVYIVGSFTNAGSVTVNNVAKWDGSNWSALGSGIPGGYLNSVAVSGNNVYVGGNFSSAGGVSANNIAKWDGNVWSGLGSGVSFGSVFTILAAGSDIYAGGAFTSAGGTIANHIAKWNGTSWTGLNSAIVSEVSSIVKSGNFLYVGTATTTLDSSYYFLKYDGTTWTPLGNGMTGGGVSSIAVSGTDIYVAGGFNSVGGVSATRVAKYNGSSWSALGSGLPSGTFGNASIIKIAIIGSDLFAVGDFTTAGGNPAEHIAKWNGNSWIPLGAGLGSGNGLTIASSGDSLYVGGEFTTAGCNISPYFARWRQTLWTGSVNTDWHNAANWGNSSVPPANAGVTIQSNNASITTADVILGSLVVTGGRTLTVGAGRTLTVNGNLYLGDGRLAGPGTLIVNGDLTLKNADVANFSSITVNGSLFLNGGNISGTGPVVVSECRVGSIVEGGSNSFVSAPLTRCVNSSGSYLFPVGTGSVYSPVELANIVGTSNFTVNPKSGAFSGPANGLSGNRLLRWWDLINGGITQADISFNYTDTEVVGSEYRYRAFSINQGNATQIPTVLNQSTNRATVRGASTFSAWTLAESQPTSLTIAGRVTTNSGRGANGVRVTLTDDQGTILYTQTSSFGYYRFNSVSTFQIYNVQVQSKKFTFTAPARSVNFDEFTGDINFRSSNY